MSLYQGSFSFILLLLGKENRLLNGRLPNIEVRLYKYFINMSEPYLADSFPCCVTGQFSAEAFLKPFLSFFKRNE